MRHILQIDNLRALAVLAVLINHLEDRWLPSGFLGVDIFFVISGFVVTKSLVNRDSNGFLVEFYLGRIKRLFPALLFCTLVSTLMALCFLTTTYSEISIRTASKALIAMSNFFLIDKALDYFSLSTSLNLFTHTWSLSVEEQFYLFYPIVFNLIRKFSKRENSFPVLIIFLTLFSFVAYLNIENPIFSYYSLSSRFWQISMGALTYYFISNKNLKFHNNLVLLFLGLLIASLSLPVHHQFISRIFVSSFTAILIVLICFINETKTYLLENIAPRLRDHNYLSTQPQLNIRLQFLENYLTHLFYIFLTSHQPHFFLPPFPPILLPLFLLHHFLLMPDQSFQLPNQYYQNMDIILKKIYL
jgi:peptidoglycan/LPS O-acetylase OafA/YrhL